MSGLDGALIHEVTQGINAPAQGQQGYAVFADQQTPYPNLTYLSPAEAVAALGAAKVSHHAFTTVGSHTWTIPDNLVYAAFVLVGGGQGGAAGGNGAAGDGGMSGAIVQCGYGSTVIAPSASVRTLQITVGAGGAAGGGAGYSSQVANDDGVFLHAPGASASDTPIDTVPGLVSRATTAAWRNVNFALGGVGGAGVAGARGMHSLYGRGGSPGSTNNAGNNGYGYGAGGGGGRQTSGSSSGGGGGAGGYGFIRPDGNGGGTVNTAGYHGTRGACFLTAWVQT